MAVSFLETGSQLQNIRPFVRLQMSISSDFAVLAILTRAIIKKILGESILVQLPMIAKTDLNASKEYVGNRLPRMKWEIATKWLLLFRLLAFGSLHHIVLHSTSQHVLSFCSRL